MKKFLLVILILVPILSNGQAWKNSNILGGSEDVYVLSALSDNESNTIIFGYFNGSLTPKDHPQVDSRGGRDFFLAKYDTSSNLLWLKGIGGKFNEFFDGSAAVGDDGNIYVTGGFQDSLAYTELDTIVSTGFHDIFLSKYDPDGNNLWCVNVGSGSSFQRSTSLDVDNQGNIMMGGYYNDSISVAGDTTLDANQFKDYFYAKFDPLAGDLIWAKALKSINSNYSGFIYTISSADDHHVLSGVFGDSVDISTDTLVSETSSYYDTHIIKTDLDGDILWTREVKGVRWDYSYTSTLDADNSIYVTGYTDSPTLIIDSTESESITRDNNFGSYDFFIAKYDTDGTLQWVKRNGGSGDDRLINSMFYDGDLWVTGFFADTLRWGAQTLITNGPSDRDMFYGSIDADGNYASATKYNGRNNSIDEGYGVFYDNKGNLYAVILTNSDLFNAEDTSYINTSENFVIILGAVGCLPITVTEVISEHLDVTGCFGDSTGRIEINAAEGFGPQWEYSLGEGFPFQPSPTFNDLPAGSYQLEAKDSRNCRGTGPTVSITQPEEINVLAVDSTDVLCFGESTGTISVNAEGGTGTLTYSVNGGVTYPYIVGTDVANVAADTFDIAVKDANNCVKMPGTATILEPEELVLDTVSTTDLTCFGDMSGAIELTASGGIEPYEYSIDGASYQPEPILGSLSAGTYTPMVMDDNDCETALETNVIIKQPEELTITLESSSDITDDADGEIVVSASGGTTPYTYTISPSAGTQDPDSVFTFVSGEGGDYIVEVDDANNCGPVSTSAITISDLTNISNLDILNASIYPNPSSGMITVEFNTGKSEMTMEVFSIDGRNVMSRQVYSAGGQVKETLDLSSLDKGMYMIRVDQQTLSSAVVLN